MGDKADAGIRTRIEPKSMTRSTREQHRRRSSRHTSRRKPKQPGRWITFFLSLAIFLYFVQFVFKCVALVFLNTYGVFTSGFLYELIHPTIGIAVFSIALIAHKRRLRDGTYEQQSGRNKIVKFVALGVLFFALGVTVAAFRGGHLSPSEISYTETSEVVINLPDGVGDIDGISQPYRYCIGDSPSGCETHDIFFDCNTMNDTTADLGETFQAVVDFCASQSPEWTVFGEFEDDTSRETTCDHRTVEFVCLSAPDFAIESDG